MQDGFRIFENGKSSKTTKINITNSPQAWGTPSLRGRTKENLTHFFGHYQTKHRAPNSNGNAVTDKIGAGTGTKPSQHSVPRKAVQ